MNNEKKDKSEREGALVYLGGARRMLLVAKKLSAWMMPGDVAKCVLDAIREIDAAIKALGLGIGPEQAMKIHEGYQLRWMLDLWQKPRQRMVLRFPPKEVMGNETNMGISQHKDRGNSPLGYCLHTRVAFTVPH